MNDLSPIGGERARRRSAVSGITDPQILLPAIGGAFAKLNPWHMIASPVMFVVEIVATLTTILFLRDVFTGGAHLLFSFQINLWLWFTLLFANFAEAVAEGRGKAQAATLRKTRSETGAKLLEKGTWREVPATALKPGDVV
ncbi:MAG TPA: potassium-transporting ATPase subunit B, partial [Rhizomicrobium sp.]